MLLVEAGPDYTPDVLPADLANGGRNSLLRHDWRFRHRRHPNKSTFPLPRGRVVGGSSAVNTCIALRGRPDDYDEWGLASWTFDECLPAFVRLERDLDFDEPNHGKDGPIPIRRHRPAELVPWQAAFLAACDEAGWPRAPDANDFESLGAGPTPMNKIDGRRISAAEGYLTADVRKRLTIRAETLVRRVLFENRRVSGVEVETNGVVEKIVTDRVVLSAGAIMTPAILMRSGIGPKDEIARIGVELVADVPAVGARLLDHPGTAIFFRPRRGGLVRGAPLIQTIMRYDSDLVQPGSVVSLPRVELPLMSIMFAMGKPRSVGRWRLETADPHAKPKIDSMLFTDEADLDAAVRGLRIARDLAATEPMKKLGAHFLPREKTIRDDAKLRDWIRFGCDSGYHPCGTVPLGEATDERGNVTGVEGLIVADASLFPTIPSCNINLPTLMVGERFAEWSTEW